MCLTDNLENYASILTRWKRGSHAEITQSSTNYNNQFCLEKKSEMDKNQKTNSINIQIMFLFFSDMFNLQFSGEKKPKNSMCYLLSGKMC